MQGLDALRCLRELNLASNRITHVDSASFAGLHELRSLTLAHNRIDALGDAFAAGAFQVRAPGSKNIQVCWAISFSSYARP